MDAPSTPLAAYQAERTARREGKDPTAEVAPAETPDAVEAKVDAPVVAPIEAPTHERFTDPDTGEVLDLRTRRGKRIQALVAERNTYRTKYEQAMSRQPPAEPKTPPAPVAKDTDGEPDPKTYPNQEFDAGFLRDHAAFTAQKAVKQALADQQELTRRAQAETEMGHTITGYRARATVFAKTQPDFDAVISGTQGDLVSPVMQHAIFASEQGPQIAYWLGTHPADAAQWFAETKDLTAASMPFVKRQLEALVTTTKAAPAPPQSRISNAPPPAPAVSGAQVPPAAPVSAQTQLPDYRKIREQRRRAQGLATV